LRLGKEGKRRKEHFVSFPDIQRHQREKEGVRPRSYADGMRGVAVSGNGLFYLLDLRAQDKLLGLKNLV